MPGAILFHEIPYVNNKMISPNIPIESDSFGTSKFAGNPAMEPFCTKSEVLSSLKNLSTKFGSDHALHILQCTGAYLAEYEAAIAMLESEGITVSDARKLKSAPNASPVIPRLKRVLYPHRTYGFMDTSELDRYVNDTSIHRYTLQDVSFVGIQTWPQNSVLLHSIVPDDQDNTKVKAIVPLVIELAHDEDADRNIYCMVLAHVRGNQSFLNSLNLADDNRVSEKVHAVLEEAWQEQEEWEDYTLSVGDMGWNADWFNKCDTTNVLIVDVTVD